MKRTIIALAACFGALVCVSGAAPVEPVVTAAEPSAVLETVETVAPEVSPVADTTAEAAETEAEEAQVEEPTPVEETEPEAETETAAPVTVNTDEIYLLANVMAGESYQSEWDDMIKVGMAICNRVDSPDPIFPDTLYGVVTQPHQMNYIAGRSIAQVYIDAATEVYTTWQAIKSGAQLYWDYSILFWGAGGGATNIFRSEY